MNCEWATRDDRDVHVSTVSRSNAEVTPLHEREERSLTGLGLTRRSVHSNHHLPRAADVGVRFTVERLEQTIDVLSSPLSVLVTSQRDETEKTGSDNPRLGDTQAGMSPLFHLDLRRFSWSSRRKRYVRRRRRRRRMGLTECLALECFCLVFFFPLVTIICLLPIACAHAFSAFLH